MLGRRFSGRCAIIRKKLSHAGKLGGGKGFITGCRVHLIWPSMGSEEREMVGGGSSQRVDIGLNSMTGRSVQPDQFSRNTPGSRRAEALKNPRPGEGFGEYADPQKYIGRERPAFLQSTDRDYREGVEGFHLEHRIQKDTGGDGDERKNFYRGNQMAGLGAGSDQDWSGVERGVGSDGDYRDMSVRGEVSEVSQSEGTEEEEDDDANMEGEGDGGVVRDRSREMLLGERLIPHPQMASIECRMRQDSTVPPRGVEGFQRSCSDGERGMKGPASTSSSFGLYLQPSPQVAGLQFINYATQSPSGGQTLLPVDANATQNGVGAGLSGAGVQSTYSVSRDSYAKGVAARDTSMASSLHDQQAQGHLHDSLQSSDENYYTSLLNSTGSNNSAQKVHDVENDLGSPDLKRNSRLMDPPIAAPRSLRTILSDPVSGQLMDDATIFACGHSFGSVGLQQVISSSLCSTCGLAVRTTSMAANYALRAAVQAYKREGETFAEVRPVKRRRDRVEQDGGLAERQLSDGHRSKGVQFPFVVTDRVLIKGNKRTPERFVGREAVITNQCLNGWYLVRTLDNGESVRLQYRSLQKLGGQQSPNASHFGCGWL